MKSTKVKPKDTAFECILRLANYSDKTVRSIRERLCREGYSEDDIDDAISKALDYGILDDDRYARLYVSSRLSKGEGRNGIIRALKRMGIELGCENDAYEMLEELSDDDEIARALNLLSRMHLQGNNLREKAYRTLIRKGYSSSVSSTAARQWCDKINSVSETKSSDFFI